VAFCSERFKVKKKSSKISKKMKASDWLKIDLFQIEKLSYQRVLAKFFVTTQKFICSLVNTKITGFLHKMPRNRFAELCKLDLNKSFRKGTLTLNQII
jgi:hypothetical protein